jgi:hypothetical protein
VPPGLLRQLGRLLNGGDEIDKGGLFAAAGFGRSSDDFYGNATRGEAPASKALTLGC